MASGVVPFCCKIDVGATFQTQRSDRLWPIKHATHKAGRNHRHGSLPRRAPAMPRRVDVAFDASDPERRPHRPPSLGRPAPPSIQFIHRAISPVLAAACSGLRWSSRSATMDGFTRRSDVVPFAVARLTSARLCSNSRAASTSALLAGDPKRQSWTLAMIQLQRLIKAPAQRATCIRPEPFSQACVRPKPRSPGPPPRLCPATVARGFDVPAIASVTGAKSAVLLCVDL